MRLPRFAWLIFTRLLVGCFRRLHESWLLLSRLLVSLLPVSWLVIALFARLKTTLVAGLKTLIALLPRFPRRERALIAQLPALLVTGAILALILRRIGLAHIVRAFLIGLSPKCGSDIGLRLALTERRAFLIIVIRLAFRRIEPAKTRILQLILFLCSCNQAEIMFSVLEKAFRSDIVTCGLRIPAKLEIFLGNTLSRATNFDIGAIRLVTPRQRIGTASAATTSTAAATTATIATTHALVLMIGSHRTSFVHHLSVSALFWVKGLSGLIAP